MDWIKELNVEWNHNTLSQGSTITTNHVQGHCHPSYYIMLSMIGVPSLRFSEMDRGAQLSASLPIENTPPTFTWRGELTKIYLNVPIWVLVPMSVPGTVSLFVLKIPNALYLFLKACRLYLFSVSYRCDIDKQKFPLRNESFRYDGNSMPVRSPILAIFPRCSAAPPVDQISFPWFLFSGTDETVPLHPSHLLTFYPCTMRPGLRSGNKLTNLEPDENYNINADEEVIDDEDVLNRSYKSKVSEAAADFANGLPRNVSSIRSLSFQFLLFSYSIYTKNDIDKSVNCKIGTFI